MLRTQTLRPLREETMKTKKKTFADRSARLIRRLALNLIAPALLPLYCSGYSHAQDEHKWTFDMGGGYSPLVGDISTRLDNGWNFRVGGGYNLTRHFTTTANYMYNGYGVSNRVLREAQVPNGNAHMWSITLDPKLRLNRSSKFDPYIVGGVGYYRRTVEFTQPALVPVFFFDPFFGVFFNTLVQANRVLGRITQDGVGGSLGAGLDVGLGNSGLKFFSEARYHYADTGRIPTRMIPVTFGLRW